MYHTGIILLSTTIALFHKHYHYSHLKKLRHREVIFFAQGHGVEVI